MIFVGGKKGKAKGKRISTAKSAKRGAKATKADRPKPLTLKDVIAKVRSHQDVNAHQMKWFLDDKRKRIPSVVFIASRFVNNIVEAGNDLAKFDAALTNPTYGIAAVVRMVAKYHECDHDLEKCIAYGKQQTSFMDFLHSTSRTYRAETNVDRIFAEAMDALKGVCLLPQIDEIARETSARRERELMARKAAEDAR